AIQRAYLGFSLSIDTPEVNSHVFKNAKTVIVTNENKAAYGELTQHRFENMAMLSLAVVPLLDARLDGSASALGVVSVFSHGVELDVRLAHEVEAVAARFVPALRGRWIQQQAVDWSKTVRDMYVEIQQHIAFITEMNSVVTTQEAYALIGRRFMGRFHFDVVGILMAEGDQLKIEYVDFSAPYAHLREAYEPFRQATRYTISSPDAACSVVFANNQRFLFDDVQQITHLPMTEKDRASLQIVGKLRTSLLVPIRLKNVPIGILWLGSLKAPLALPDSDLALIELLVSYISTSIRNAQAHDLIEHQKERIESLNRELRSKVVLLDKIARKDRLTGLNNFGSFEEELKRKIAEIRRRPDEPPLSAIILDIDYFKNFNDTYGHPAGNEVLREFATRILKSVREVDFVARFGGEEFVVLLPQCGIVGAAAIAERIRKEVEQHSFVVDGHDRWITVSGGCGEFLRNEDSADFIRRIDAALYVSKNKGRNRIETAAGNSTPA
ncbi:MAG: diguanylate cyclase, partial [Betaproteobacteria bacterium]